MRTDTPEIPAVAGPDAIRRAVWRVVLPYAVFAALWIVLSDRVVEWLPVDKVPQAWLQTIKGWLFVFVTALLLFGLVHRMLIRITEAARLQHREQARRLQALGLLNSIADGSTDAIFAKDLQGRYLLFNKAASELTAKSVDEVLGHDDTILFPPQQAARVMANDREVMERNATVTFQEEVATTSGESVFLATKGPMHDPEGRLIGVFGISRDISALKAAEFELRKLSLAVEQSPGSVIITDLDGRIEYVNAAFTAHSGFSPEEVRGRPVMSLGSELTPASTYESLWVTVLRGDTWTGEFVNRHKDGHAYTVTAHVAPIHQPDGRISHYLSVQEDITEKKRTEAELERHRLHLEELVAERTAELNTAMEQADAANRAKSAFLANMSHEIRTPMNAILGLTHLLRTDGPAPRQAMRLGKIDSAARHLLSIINDILDLSKVESGRLRLERIDFSLETVFDQVKSLIAEQAAVKGLAVEVDIAELPPWLRGDPTRLRQALLNFASNAVKFSERGTVTLRACPVEDRGDMLLVRFEVRDTGIGIPADKLPQLFRAFEQADASTTRKYGGTGLGLAITRHLSALMGGEAGAESVEGRGSTFWFTALLGKAAPAGRAPASELATEPAVLLRTAHAGARLLMAEDNPVNREVARELLQGVGMQVDAVANGLEALDRCAAHDYDLILMDLQMPVMDGLEATRTLRAGGRNHDTPIVAMTANVFDEDRHACAAAGMDDFVAKPVDPARLFATLLRRLPAREAAETARVAVIDDTPSRAAHPDAAAPGVLPDLAALARLVREMAGLLEASNMRANLLFERERALFESALGSAFGEFARHVDGFRYPEALATLQRAGRGGG